MYVGTYVQRRTSVVTESMVHTLYISLTRINVFLKCFIKVYTAYDKECTMATHMPNPINLYYT